MDFEQRIDKLTERHEALTQTIELMTHDWNERYSALTRNIDKLAAESKQTDKVVRDLGKFVTDIAEGTARLLRVVESHEHRLAELEGNA
jgi:chromosome segregation ATPase